MRAGGDRIVGLRLVLPRRAHRISRTARMNDISRRTLIAAGLSVAVLEARDRVGGRTVTTTLRGHAIDLGAHWLHAGPINPLVQLGFARGEPLRRAAQEGHVWV
ncbi:NAD(P)-binding protein, partial [Methylobacterium sp. WL122]